LAVEIGVSGEQFGMGMGENARAYTAARNLRRRWLDEPSPPLAVDDEPQWRPAPEATGDAHGAEDDREGQAGVPAV
jgi:hypothetical protein